MSDLKSLVEAALFVSGKSVRVNELAQACGTDNIDEVKAAVEALVQEYGGRQGGVELVSVDKGYLMRVKPELEERVMCLVPETEMPKALLKTLALIAYEQPVTQSKLVKTRGNRIYHYVKQLREMDFIEAKPLGRTRLLRTTPKFKTYFKLKEDVKELVKK